MDKKRSRYRRMEAMITALLCLDVVIFIAYLIFAGMGSIALKVITAIACILISGYVLYQLYMTRELLRRRSIWMTLAAACVIICVLVSLILKFPSPPYTLPQV